MRQPNEIEPDILLPRIYNNIPEEIRSLSRWALWKLTPDNKKIPMVYDGSRCASCNDPSTWTDFMTAAKILYQAYPSVKGLVIALGDGLGGLDLDDVVNSDGSLKNNYQKLLNHLDSYSELSPSGKGIHCLFEYTGQLKSRRKGSVELYFNSRFLTVTGDVFQGRSRFRNADIGAKRILSALEPQKPLLPRMPLKDVPENDNDLIDLMFKSKRGSTIKQLWDGECLHKSDSESDYALMGDLAYWTGNNEARMIRLFLESGRAERTKGRRKDYLERMARKVSL